MQGFLNVLRDGCAHKRTSWPMLPVGSNHPTGDHGVMRCLDCGMYHYVTIGGKATAWARDIQLRKVVA